jgi:hypothetical protein
VRKRSKEHIGHDFRASALSQSGAAPKPNHPLKSRTSTWKTIDTGLATPYSQCSSLPPMMAGRIPVRLLSRQLQRQSRRHFSCSSSSLDAHNFYMPAMSPTMTEGGISSWKVKPGDSFQPGDVLVEIETDKATMDVRGNCTLSTSPYAHISHRLRPKKLV